MGKKFGVWLVGSLVVAYLLFSYASGYWLLKSRDLQDRYDAIPKGWSVDSSELQAWKKHDWWVMYGIRGLKLLSSPFWAPVVQLGRLIK